jgi:hypothetical protein
MQQQMQGTLGIPFLLYTNFSDGLRVSTTTAIRLSPAVANPVANAGAVGYAASSTTVTVVAKCRIDGHDDRQNRWPIASRCRIHFAAAGVEQPAAGDNRTKISRSMARQFVVEECRNTSANAFYRRQCAIDRAQSGLGIVDNGRLG